MTFYYINNDQTKNPGLHHEVHTLEHALELNIKNKTYLGCFYDEVTAVSKAKEFYWDADGCAVCCPRAHKG